MPRIVSDPTRRRSSGSRFEATAVEVEGDRSLRPPEHLLLRTVGTDDASDGDGRDYGRSRDSQSAGDALDARAPVVNVSSTMSTLRPCTWPTGANASGFGSLCPIGSSVRVRSCASSSRGGPCSRPRSSAMQPLFRTGTRVFAAPFGRAPGVPQHICVRVAEPSLLSGAASCGSVMARRASQRSGCELAHRLRGRKRERL
jgi:hypothetical protein